MNYNAANNKPTSIKLGELKPILQREATAKDRSLHYIIKQVLKTHIESKKKK
jgi:hypothetical protein